MSDKPKIVLVHGAWTDASSWTEVIESLQADGYTVAAPSFPGASLGDDVARLRQILRRQRGPVVVAAHCYGGQIITALGSDASPVTALVYVAAFGLDQGESLGTVLTNAAPTAALAHLIVDEHDVAWIPEDDFVRYFATDINPTRAKVMHALQQGLSMRSLDDVMSIPAWRSHRTWYLVATNDDAIPPDLERMFARRMGAHTIEVASSHLVIVSHAHEVVELIKAAAASRRNA